MPAWPLIPAGSQPGRTGAGRRSSSDSPDRSGSSRVLGVCGAPVLGRGPRHGANKSKAHWGGDLVGRLQGRPEAGEPGRAAVRRPLRSCPRLAPSGPDTAALTCCCSPSAGFRRRCHRTGSPGGCFADQDSPTRNFAEGWPSRRAAALRLGSEPHPPARPEWSRPQSGWRREAAPLAARARPEPPAPQAAAGPLPSASAGRDRTHPLAGRFGGAWGWRGGFPIGKKRLACPPLTIRSQRPASRSEA